MLLADSPEKTWLGGFTKLAWDSSSLTPPQPTIVGGAEGVLALNVVRALVLSSRWGARAAAAIVAHSMRIMSKDFLSSFNLETPLFVAGYGMAPLAIFAGIEFPCLPSIF